MESMDVDFEQTYRDVLETREELEHLLPMALELATHPEDLKRFAVTVDKMLRSYADVRKEIMNRIIQLDHASRDAPVRPPSQIAATSRASPVTVPTPTWTPSTPMGPPPSVSVSGRSTPQNTPYVMSSRSSSMTSAQPATASTSQSNHTNGEHLVNGFGDAYADVVDLGRIRVPANRLPSQQALNGHPISRIWFPFLNPKTTPDSLKNGLEKLGYNVKNMELHRWQNDKFRGCGSVELISDQQMWSLAGRSDIIIDGWIVTPKLCIEEIPVAEVNGDIKPVELTPEDLDNMEDEIQKDLFDRDLSDPGELKAHQRLHLFKSGSWMSPTHPLEAYMVSRVEELKGVKDTE